MYVVITLCYHTYIFKLKNLLCVLHNYNYLFLTLRSGNEDLFPCNFDQNDNHYDKLVRAADRVVARNPRISFTVRIKDDV
jgi:hypothetical protein